MKLAKEDIGTRAGSNQLGKKMGPGKIKRQVKGAERKHKRQKKEKTHNIKETDHISKHRNGHKVEEDDENVKDYQDKQVSNNKRKKRNKVMGSDACKTDSLLHDLNTFKGDDDCEVEEKQEQVVVVVERLRDIAKEENKRPEADIKVSKDVLPEEGNVFRKGEAPGMDEENKARKRDLKSPEKAIRIQASCKTQDSATDDNADSNQMNIPALQFTQDFDRSPNPSLPSAEDNMILLDSATTKSKRERGDRRSESRRRSQRLKSSSQLNYSEEVLTQVEKGLMETIHVTLKEARRLLGACGNDVNEAAEMHFKEVEDLHDDEDEIDGDQVKNAGRQTSDEVGVAEYLDVEPDHKLEANTQKWENHITNSGNLLDSKVAAKEEQSLSKKIQTVPQNGTGDDNEDNSAENVTKHMEVQESPYLSVGPPFTNRKPRNRVFVPETPKLQRLSTGNSIIRHETPTSSKPKGSGRRPRKRKGQKCKDLTEKPSKEAIINLTQFEAASSSSSPPPSGNTRKRGKISSGIENGQQKIQCRCGTKIIKTSMEAQKHALERHLFFFCQQVTDAVIELRKAYRATVKLRHNKVSELERIKGRAIFPQHLKAFEDVEKIKTSILVRTAKACDIHPGNMDDRKAEMVEEKISANNGVFDDEEERLDAVLSHESPAGYTKGPGRRRSRRRRSIMEKNSRSQGSVSRTDTGTSFDNDHEDEDEVEYKPPARKH